MDRRRIILILAGSVLALGLAAGLYAWLAAPRLLSYTPAGESGNLPLFAPLEITFSQAMQPESVAERLEITPAIEGSITWSGNRLTFTPARPWPSGTLVQVRLRSGARAQAGLPVWRETVWAFQTSQMWLAYLWPASDLADIYTLDPRTGDVRRLTISAGVRDFTASLDGLYIYFIVDKLRGGSLIRRLERPAISANTGVQPAAETIYDCGEATCRRPTLSPDGKRLAFESAPPVSRDDSGAVGVWVLDLDSQQAALAGQADHATRYPAWSSQAALLFYDERASAYIVQQPGGPQLTFANQTGEPASWSPDGRYFVAPEIIEEVFDLLEITASGHLLRYDTHTPGAALDLSGQNNLEDTIAVYAPNGQTLAIARKFLDPQRRTAGRQIWLLTPDGQEARQLTDEMHYTHYQFAWSLDSEQLAYVRFNQSNLTEPPELWLVNRDGSAPTQLVIGGYGPQWLP